jgi:hypothetical protein
MSEADNTQLTEEELLIANHFINTIPLRDIIGVIKSISVERAKNIKSEIGDEKYNKFVEELKLQNAPPASPDTSANDSNSEVEEIEVIPERKTPSIIMP